MNYISTRNASVLNESVSSACAIKRGLAGNGGLYMPSYIPSLGEGELSALASLPYSERAAKILSYYLTDYTYKELLADCRAAYGPERFPDGAAIIKKVRDSENLNTHYLELWHGPTCAFKDMALQLMPRLLSRALLKTAEEKNALILVATSGDTGKAALEGYSDVDRIKIKVFYPKNGVSDVQRLQMTTQAGSNVSVCAVEGNFDDCQLGVKRMFVDKLFAKELAAKNLILSSANSINFGRLVPQIVYYISAYCDLIGAGEIKCGDLIDICVPTGNFGNILAAYMAKRMGLPVRRLVCASNQNNVLTDFFNTGIYDMRRDFHLTISPSMDILLSNNLERLLYLIAGDEKVREWMRQLREEGFYKVDGETLKILQSEFSAYFASEQNTMKTIKAVWEQSDYLIDTHTAVASYCAGLYRKEGSYTSAPMLIASTASPFKFASDVLSSLTGERFGSLEATVRLSELTKTAIPSPLSGLSERKVRFNETVKPEDMPNSVRAFACE